MLGYRQIVADLIWLQAVQHIGAKRDTQLGYTWTYHAVDVLTDLDPTFIPPYQATGLFLGVLVGRHDEGLAILKKEVGTIHRIGDCHFWPDISRTMSAVMRLERESFFAWLRGCRARLPIFPS